LVFALFSQTQTFAQQKKVEKKPDLPKAEIQTSTAVKVTQIDDAKLKEIIKPNGKPLLVNFWATWCDPCREEFPDLVKLENDYRGKIDVITISLDDLAEINTSVPKFLSEMKAEMPNYLLGSKDEGAIISTISKDWSGGLPFTILYSEKGETLYFKQGKFKVPELREKIDSSINLIETK
jgi:thiol-disulfide isomerase/thioredoxin